jgi:pimeloyl-ACP methyl ester carboxylesterase
VYRVANSWISGDVLSGYENVESFWMRKNTSEMTEEEMSYIDPHHYIKKNELTGLSAYIVHGDCDITVPYLHSERLYEALRGKLGDDSTVFHLVPGMGHAADSLYSDEMLADLKHYLDEKLGS